MQVLWVLTHYLASHVIVGLAGFGARPGRGVVLGGRLVRVLLALSDALIVAGADHKGDEGAGCHTRAL